MINFSIKKNYSNFKKNKIKVIEKKENLLKKKT